MRLNMLADHSKPRGIAACAIALSALTLFADGANAQSRTLDRIREAGRIKVGYRIDARPFSFRDASGQPDGYSVALCQEIAVAVRRSPGLAGTRVEWVPVTGDGRFSALEGGQIDLLCGADTETLARRTTVSFSIPIFPGGIGALVRSDAPARLREVLSGRGQSFQPTWRASAVRALQARGFSAVRGTTAEQWLTRRMKDLDVIANVSSVSDYDAGVQDLLARRSDALFGERAVLLDAARRRASSGDLIVSDQLFTREPLAMAMARSDDDFRLLVDRTLSRIYRSAGLDGIYTKWFGEPDETTLTFFRWNALPD